MAWAEANMWESHTVLKAANAKTSGAEEHVSHTPIEPVGASIAPAPAPAPAAAATATSKSSRRPSAESPCDNTSDPSAQFNVDVVSVSELTGLPISLVRGLQNIFDSLCDEPAASRGGARLPQLDVRKLDAALHLFSATLEPSGLLWTRRRSADGLHQIKHEPLSTALESGRHAFTRVELESMESRQLHMASPRFSRPSLNGGEAPPEGSVRQEASLSSFSSPRLSRRGVDQPAATLDL